MGLLRKASHDHASQIFVRSVLRTARNAARHASTEVSNIVDHYAFGDEYDRHVKLHSRNCSRCFDRLKHSLKVLDAVLSQPFDAPGLRGSRRPRTIEG
jgi:hypothetical protein